ncbi:MAG: hypothetical protein ACOYEC_05940 [Christensenellales bacterium]|jgi:hypothetical protein|nr:hypothetical protein [Clostridiales bacterium]
MIKKEQLEDFIYQVNTLIKHSEFYSLYSNSILEGKNDYKISQVYTKKNYSTDWIDRIEECITALDTIVRNPRKFIVIEEDIVDISLARSISQESVKHLAQHTNLINSVNKEGMVIPSKILNTSKEESYEIYENRFIYTLLLKLRDFIDRRYESIKNALMESGEISVEINSEFSIDSHKMTYNMESEANIPFDEIVKPKSKGSQLTNVERLNRIKSIISDFLNSAFGKEMRSCALVRPPIQRTNVILKDPNFKKALLLWQYIESTEHMEFKVETIKETSELPPNLSEKYRSLILWNTLLMQSLAASRDAGETIEQTREKEKELADEYVTKNIDDFVPDDFPYLKMELSEIRKIFQRIPGIKTVRLTEIKKMNAAIDRVLRQYRINKAKEDSKLKLKLIAQQLKEEAEAKRLALKEAQEVERLRKKEEERLAKEAARRAKEQLEAEKRAERERKEAERQLKLQQEREEAERAKEAERQAIEAIEKIVAEAEREFRERVDAERYVAEQRLREEAERAAQRLREEREAYWAEQRDLAIRLLTEKNEARLTEMQKEALEKLREQESARLYAIRRIEALLHAAATIEHHSNIERLLDEARTFRSEDEIISIKAEVEAKRPPLAQLEASVRLEILKARLESIKQRRERKKAQKAKAKKEKDNKK